MKRTVIDISKASKKDAHLAIARKLGFPESYGGNLDALHDALYDCCCREKLRLVIYIVSGQNGFARVLRDVSLKNSSLSLRIVTIGQ